MVRFVAFDSVLFLVPFAIYALWLLGSRRSVSDAAEWTARTVGYLALAGAVLLVGVLVAFVRFDTAPPGGTYIPAHMENGRIIEGHIQPGPTPQ